MDTPALTDLKARLAQPQGAALRDELLERVNALELRLRTRIAAGLSREEFPDWFMTAEAAAAAREILAMQRVAAPVDPQAPDMVPASFSYP